MRTVLLMTAAFLVGTLVAPSLAVGHGGGLDSNGGHRDKKAGTYHFHKGPLAGKAYASKESALRARAALSEKSSGGTKTGAAKVIKRASTTKKVDALIELLVKKRVITEAELARQLER